MSRLAIIVDENDNFIKNKDRYTLERGDIIRISALWLENGKGEVLIAQRSIKKKHDPGLWGTAAAGTLEPGEAYEANIIKEAEEELGLTGVKLEPHKHWFFMRPDNGTGRHVQTYKAVVDWPIEKFKLQEDEVDEIKWISKAELFKDVKENRDKYTESAQNWEEIFG